MIFRNGLHHKVMAGQKSETRRPLRWRKGEMVECHYQPGADYAIHAKPKSPQVGRIRIVAVERQRLGDITPESVKREGHKTLEEFKEAWLETHGLKRWNPDKEVWAIVFEPFTDVVRIPGNRYGDDRGYVKDDRLGIDRHLGESPPDEVVEEFAKCNQRQFNVDREDELAQMQARVIANEVAKAQRQALKVGIDLGPRFRSMLREWQREVAEARREAA